MPVPLPPRQVAASLRRRVLEHVLANGGGYMSQACSSAELLATLYTRVLRLGASEAPLIPPPYGEHALSGGAWNGPRAPELDRFLFSPVHYALVLYALLIELGRLGPQALRDFNADGSTIEMIGAEHSPGIEVTAGSLAQALSVGGGIALARKLRGEPGRTWVFMSDGELQEGQTWEALAAASFHGLDRLALIMDCNDQQCDGPMAQVMRVSPTVDRLRAFGWEAREVDGHDPEAIVEASRPADRPVAVLCRTDPCRGLELLRSRAPKLHYLRFVDEDERRAYARALEAM